MTESAQEYPEQRPVADTESPSFVFSTIQGQAARKELAERIALLQGRIDYINENMKLKGHPIIEILLQLTRDPGELVKLGKCLERVAEVLPELDELKKRKQVVDIASENPMWLASVFGDYTADIDRMMEELDNGSQS